MLWPIVLPFQITLVIWLGALLVVGILAPKWGVQRRKSILLGFMTGILLFILSCVGVKYVLDPFRFGVFQYPNFAAVHDWRVQRYLPEGATDISIEKRWSGNGYRANFKISKENFETWFDSYWIKYRQYSSTEREEIVEANLEEIVFWFGDLGWPELPDAKQYEGPRAENGAGFSIWFSESQGIAYEQAGYW